MKLVDANVLLYADNESAQQHDQAITWLERALEGNEPLLVPWLSALAFLRISTHPGIHDMPHTVASAMTFLKVVIQSPHVIAGVPDGRHWDRVETLLGATGVAALALQYDATVVSFDNDFTRFPGVRWELPTVPPSRPGESE